MAETKKMKIAVIMGGESAERDVSIASGLGVVDGLRLAGYDAFGIDTALGKEQFKSAGLNINNDISEEPPSSELLEIISTEKAIETICSNEFKQFDLVFNALHGGIGENGKIQALMDILGIRYTGSGVLASAVAMDKLASKLIVSGSGMLTPGYFSKMSNDLGDERELIKEAEHKTGFPVVVKPNDQGSSVGLDICRQPGQLFEIAVKAAKYSNKVLFEKFIEGRELTVGILGDIPLPIAEVIPQGGFYDYHHKYTPGLTDKVVPAEISDKETAMVQQTGIDVFTALGCKGYGRIDFRYSKDGKLYFLEANTLPGMTKTSLVPKAAKAAGIEFHELLDKIVSMALNP